jgi:hypothetical protein
MQALARVLGGPAARQLVRALRQSEADAAVLPAVDAKLKALPMILLRRILASFDATVPVDLIPPTGSRCQEAIAPVSRSDEMATKRP